MVVKSLEVAFGIYKNKFPELTLDRFRSWFSGNLYENDDFQQYFNQMPRAEFDAQYPQAMKNKKLVAGMDNVIAELAKAYRLIIVSSTAERSIRDTLGAYGLSAFFDQILGYESGKSKVSKFQDFFKKHDVHQSVFITDTTGDVEEARLVGVQSIAVSWGYHSADILQRALPLMILSDPLEIVPAVRDYFIRPS